MQETGLAGCWERPVALISNRVIGAVDPNDRNADRVSATALKLSDFVSKIVDYAINLFDHGLRQHLHFNADLDRGNRPTRHQVARINDRSSARNDLTKGPSPRRAATPRRLFCTFRTQPLRLMAASFSLRRTADRDKVFIEMHGHEVTLVGRPVLVYLVLKQPPELCQQPVFRLRGRLRQL
jgi:hypothetical protein